MIGISLQVVRLLVFNMPAGIYAAKVSRNRQSLSAPATSLLYSTKFRTFISAVSLAYLAIPIHCVYRIDEKPGGWQNHISRNEVDFMILDGLYDTL